MQISQVRELRAQADSYSVLTLGQRIQYGVLVVVWVAAVVVFWRFWFMQKAIENTVLYLLTSAALFYETTLLPSVYLFFLSQMRQTEPIPAPLGRRVALVTLCVPSKEDIAIIERQIRALVAVRYPHDSWLLDEEDDPTVRALCERHGVRHFTRRGVPAWNQPHPPFQAKTKAGNVNAWLFEHGKDYEFFVQLDIDHTPIPEYLDRTLGYFHDPRVAWVQAPSVYGNLDSWTARGSAEQELVLQGPLQMGFYGFSRTPFIIGSHSTYRTSAMLAIGGMQPTRAEDHLDTVVLSQHGYRGVFLNKVIATGDGPETFDTYLAQQFAWAYSMIQVLFHHAFKYVRHYSFRTAVQFVFVQTWYISWSFSMVLLFLLPLWMLLTDQAAVTVPLDQFLVYYLPLPLGAFGIWWWSRQWFNPAGVRLSWRGIVLHIARWPVVFWAFINVLLRIKRPYMITPKGKARGDARPFNLSAQGPYLILIALSLLASWWYLASYRGSRAQGYLLFVIEGALFMLLVFWVALMQDIRSLRRDGVTIPRTILLRSRPLLVGLAFLAGVGLTAGQSAPLIATAAAWRGDSIVQMYTPVTPDIAVPSEGVVLPAPPLPATSVAPQATPTPVPPLPLDRGAALRARQDFFTASNQQRFFGAYDPRGALNGADLGVEMIYVNLYPQSLDGLDSQLRAIHAKGRVPLVTVEPWALVYQGYQESTLLPDLIAGRYDQQLRQVGAAMNVVQGPVLVRPMHEMDIAELYAWSGQPASTYIEAYRHIYNLLQGASAGNLLWIWSPAGNGNATQYYPGDDYVDYVGFTALASQSFNLQGPDGTLQSFTAVVSEKYARLQGLGKPLLISEAGVHGAPNEREAWLAEMFSTLDRYPSLRGVVYYNDFNAINKLVPVPPDYSITQRQWDDARP